MAKGNEKVAAGRRDFLKLAGVSAVTGTAAVAAGTATAEAAAPVDGASGYRETDHVKTYYKLARF
jgi:ABC-type polysaccharide transport system permease subunit